MRGKILNVERKDDAALYKNQELSALIIALGLGTKGSNGSSSKKGRSSKASSKAGSPRASSSIDAAVSVEEGEQEGEVAVGDGSGTLKNLR